MSDPEAVVPPSLRPGALSRFYARDDLLGAILSALTEAGADPDALRPDDLAPVDEFHTRGREATADLAALLDPARGTHVLDVGSGLGGTARYLAHHHDCRVTAVELTRTYGAVCHELNRRVGLASSVDTVCAAGTALPFTDNRFDAACTLHMQMNVADKPALYEELARVLSPGGRLAFFEVFARGTEPLHYPVPWSDGPALSHLVAPSTARALLAHYGLHPLHWRDVTVEALDWFTEVGRRNRAAGPSPLGLHLVMGPAFRDKVRNLRANLSEGRAALIQAVLEKR